MSKPKDFFFRQNNIYNCIIMKLCHLNADKDFLNDIYTVNG